MPNFVPLPGYPYANKDPLPHGDVNTLSEALVKAHNADEGSDHAPTATSTWSGSVGFGWSFADEFPLDGEVDVSAGLTLTAPVSGSVIFGELVAIDVNGPLTFKEAPGGAPGSAKWENGAGATWLSGSTLTLASGATASLTGTTNVRGAFTIKAGASGQLVIEAGTTNPIAGTLQILSTAVVSHTGGSTLTGTTEDSRTTTRTGLTTMSGSGARTAYRPPRVLADASEDVTVADDTVRVRQTLTGIRVYTLRHTGTVPTAGQRIRAYRTGVSTPSAHSASFVREDSTVLFKFAASQEGFADFEFTGTEWECVGGAQFAGSDTRCGYYDNVW